MIAQGTSATFSSKEKFDTWDADGDVFNTQRRKAHTRKRKHINSHIPLSVALHQSYLNTSQLRMARQDVSRLMAERIFNSSDISSAGLAEISAVPPGMTSRMLAEAFAGKERESTQFSYYQMHQS